MAVRDERPCHGGTGIVLMALVAIMLWRRNCVLYILCLIWFDHSDFLSNGLVRGTSLRPVLEIRQISVGLDERRAREEA